MVFFRSTVATATILVAVVVSGPQALPAVQGSPLFGVIVAFGNHNQAEHKMGKIKDLEGLRGIAHKSRMPRSPSRSRATVTCPLIPTTTKRRSMEGLMLIDPKQTIAALSISHCGQRPQ